MVKRILALIDGEHYPLVIKDALAELNKHGKVVAALLIGLGEKIEKSMLKTLGVNVLLCEEDIAKSLVRAIDTYKPDVVFDLSGDPLLDYEKRFSIACEILLKGCEYAGADFHFKPVIFKEVLEKPSLAIIGLSKRVGKTAVAAYVARLLKERGESVVVLTMGRGGPREPEIAEDVDTKYLLKLSEEEKHAASDYLEDALISKVRTVGCRRCSTGMVGKTFLDNLEEGARVANKLGNFIIVEGSGAALPCIKTNKTILVASANLPLHEFSKYFGPYKIKLCDMVVLTCCEEPFADKAKIAKIKQNIMKIKEVPIVETIFRPRPLGNVTKKDVMLVTTAKGVILDKLVNYLEKKYHCNIIYASSNLANRESLRDDCKKYLNRVDVVLAELKAAAVDIVVKEAIKVGTKVVYIDNVPIAKCGNLDAEVLKLYEEAKKCQRK